MMASNGILRGMCMALLALMAPVAMRAESLSGTVTNRTTGKPAAGVTVTLVDPMGGMAEVGTAKSDAQGHFKVSAEAAKGPRLARAERGGVNYFHMITPGTTSVDLDVYDAAEKVEGIAGSADVVKMQADGGNLQVAELFAITNQSNPPRALAAKHTFEFVLPDGATLENASAQGPNGQPIEVTPEALGEKNHYGFAYSLKPGETRFQVSYHLPYSGKASFTPRLTLDFEHYVLATPSAMTIAPANAKQYQAMNNQPGMNVEISLHAKKGDDLAFILSGTGAFAEAAAAEEGGGQVMGGQDNRPGGGLGKPIDAMDALAVSHWYTPWGILAILLILLIGGGVWTHENTRLAQAAVLTPALANAASSGAATLGMSAAKNAPATDDGLMSGLKEELFQLELDRQQDKISLEEYASARSALEQTLQRAVRRRSS